MAAQIGVEVDFRAVGVAMGHAEMRVREQIAVVEEDIAAEPGTEDGEDRQTEKQGAAHGGIFPWQIGLVRLGLGRLALLPGLFGFRRG